MAKLNSSGTALSYATFLGGTGYDYGQAIVIDSTGSAYLTGYTESTNFPTTAGVYDTSHNGGYDVFVAKLNSSGTSLSYATFLGGTSGDAGTDLAIDSTGNAYLTGSTSSTDFPTTAGALDTSYNGNDVFIAKLNSNGGAMFSDYFLQALGRGASVYNSFTEGQETARRAHADQIPWLDSNGNGLPNEPADFLEAQQRGFAYAGTFAANEKLPPYIAWVNSPTTITNRKGELSAQITDDVPNGKLTVKAVIYKPSYITPTTSESLVAEYDTLPKVLLEDSDKDNIYRGLYEGFDETGTYRIVVYAVDEDSLQSNPREVVFSTGAKVYLPVIVKR